MDNHRRPLKIAALGMEQRTYSTLQLFFHGHCKDNYVLVEEKSADISIIDMDGFQACRMLEEHKRHYPDQPSILISLSDNKAHDAVYVRKPILLEALSSALCKARERLQKAATKQPVQEIPFVKITPQLQKASNEPKLENLPALNNSPQKTVKRARSGSRHFDQYQYSDDSLADDADLEFIDLKLAERFNPDNPVQVAKFQYQPEETLQGYFQQAYFTALQQQRNVVLRGVWRPITIFYQSKKLGVEQNFRHLYALSGMRFDKSDVSIDLLDDSMDSESDLNETVLPAEPFLWKLAIRTSRGRVPVNTSFTTPIKLIRWPNFTRIIITPHALRIAALWARQPTSLMDTASYLAIPLQHVFMFYAAAVSLNFAAPVMTEKDSSGTTLPPVKRHRYRKIFQHLLERLRNN